MGTILVWATAWAFVALIARMVAQPHRKAQSGGKRLRAEIDAIYGGEHEYARVSPAAFPDADLAFYDRSAAELEAIGFRRIADVEDLTHSRVYPDRRMFLRVLVDEGGVIRAAIYHLHIRGGGAAILSAVGMAPRDLYVFELITESPRGRFVATSNTKGLDKLSSPNEVEAERMDVGTSLMQVVNRHRARLTERARRRGADAPVTLWTWEDVLASIQRGHVVAAKHRQALGGLSREEVERYTGRPLTAAEEVFLREVRGEAGAENDKAAGHGATAGDEDKTSAETNANGGASAPPTKPASATMPASTASATVPASTASATMPASTASATMPPSTTTATTPSATPSATMPPSTTLATTPTATTTTTPPTTTTTTPPTTTTTTPPTTTTTTPPTPTTPTTPTTLTTPATPRTDEADDRTASTVPREPLMPPPGSDKEGS